MEHTLVFKVTFRSMGMIGTIRCERSSWEERTAQGVKDLHQWHWRCIGREASSSEWIESYDLLSCNGSFRSCRCTPWYNLPEERYWFFLSLVEWLTITDRCCPDVLHESDQLSYDLDRVIILQELFTSDLSMQVRVCLNVPVRMRARVISKLPCPVNWSDLAIERSNLRILRTAWRVEHDWPRSWEMLLHYPRDDPE